MKVVDSLPIRLLTHNIRYATTSPFKGEEPWAVRKFLIINELRFHTIHNPEAFISLQEVLHDQLQDILSGLNGNGVEWAYIGVGRDDGAEAGEYSPILYRPSAWVLLLYRTMWLSETPDRPSKGWDAASTRILTIGWFHHRQSRKRVVAMNTHLDDQGSQSRLESAKIIANQVATISMHQRNLPVFFAGDLNSEPHMEAYQYLSTNSSMVDIQTMVLPKDRYGHKDTFTGFGYEGLPPSRIDFLFIKADGEGCESTDDEVTGAKWMVKGYGVLENRFDDGIYNSDHRAVVADLLLT